MVAHELEFERVRRAEKARTEREFELAELDKKQGGARAAADALFNDVRMAEAAAAQAVADEEKAAEEATELKKKAEEEDRKRKQALKDRVLEKISARKPIVAVQAKVGCLSLV
jgi:hypothetical protein